MDPKRHPPQARCLFPFVVRYDGGMRRVTTVSLTPDNASSVIDKDWYSVVVTKSEEHPQGITLRKILTGINQDQPQVDLEGVVFAELDSDAHPTTTSLIGITRASAIYIFKFGELIASTSGDVRATTAVRWIINNISK